MVVNRRIDVHVDELRVVGVPEAHPEALADGFRAQLQRLLAENGIPGEWDGNVRVDRVAASLPARGTGAGLGRAAATSTYEGLAR